MIENSTSIYDEAYKSDVKESLAESDSLLVTMIKQNIQCLAKEPTQSVLDNILSYSKSFTSK